MRNPFKKQIPTDELISILFIAIDELSISIEELRLDLEDLTDFVESELD
jgi:hypothetical protein